MRVGTGGAIETVDSFVDAIGDFVDGFVAGWRRRDCRRGLLFLLWHELSIVICLEINLLIQSI